MKISDVLAMHSNSQSELARALNVSRQAVNIWVKKGELPLIRQVWLLAEKNDIEGIKNVLRKRVSSI
jgi:DNA-binding XRE family transcriptional regulator